LWLPTPTWDIHPIPKMGALPDLFLPRQVLNCSQMEVQGLKDKPYPALEEASMESLAMTLGILMRLAVPLGLLALVSAGLRRWEVRQL
jgi:hypothetical protein